MAAHRVLEWIARSAPELRDQEDAEDRIARRWMEEARQESEVSEANPLERSFGPAQRWPAYGRIAAGLRVDGVALVHELADLPIERRLAEQGMATSDGTVRGTPDLVLVDPGGAATIIDHKVGGVSEDDVVLGGRYEQQVLLYSAMARDSGLSPTKAEIRPLGRPSRPMELLDARLTAAIVGAHAEMERYNEAVVRGEVIQLARPSESSCGWCPFILDCPAVWVDPAPDLGELAVMEGDIETVQVLTSSTALRVSSPDGTTNVTGLPVVDILGREPAPGDRVRLAGLRKTAPGRMRGHPGRVLMSLLR